MAYSGIFRKYGEYITYSFAHFPWIYIFSLNGPLITIIHTKDDIPHPSIIRYKNYYLYERGKTHNSNLFSCVKSDIVFVLSYRVPSNHNGFLLDRYSLSSGQYLSSIDVPGPDKTGNQDITCVWSMSDTICIKARGKLWLMQIGWTRSHRLIHLSHLHITRDQRKEPCQSSGNEQWQGSFVYWDNYLWTRDARR